MLVHPIANKFAISRVQNNDARSKELLPQKTVNNMTLPSFADAKSLVNMSFKAKIHTYAGNGYLSDLKREICNGVNVNEPDSTGFTPLMEAGHWHRINTFNELLKQPDIDVNAQPEGKDTALIRVSRNGYDDMVKKLVERPEIDVNIQRKDDGETALIAACFTDQDKAVAELLKHPDIDISLKNKKGQDALFIALSVSNPKIAKMLKDYKRGVDRREGARVNNEVNTESVSDINARDENGNTPLMLACQEKNIKEVEELLQHPDIDVNAQSQQGNTALIYACRTGKTEIVENLINRPDIDVNIQDKQGNTALIWASFCGLSTVVEKILQHPDVDINIQDFGGTSALVWANRKNQPKIVKMIKNYQRGVDRREGVIQKSTVDVNEKDENGDTALIRACRDGKIEEVEKLLQHPDIDVNAQDRYESTALMHACENKREDIVTKLLEHPDININAQNIFGSTALNWACNELNNAKIVEKLLQHPDTDVNIQGFLGDTALITAAKTGATDSVEKLLQCPDVDVNLKTVEGDDALHFANSATAQLIRNYKPGVDKRKGVKPKQINMDKITSFTEVWSDKEKQDIEKLLEEKNYNALVKLLESKGQKLNKEYEKTRNQVNKIKEVTEKSVRKTETQKIRKEEQDAANKKLEVKYSELDKTKAEYNEKNAELDRLINNYDSMLSEAREQIREEEKIAAEEKVAERMAELDKEQADANRQTAEKMAELDKTKKEYEEKNKALDNLINNYQTMLADDIKDAKSGFRALYGVKPETFPEKMGFGEQLVYVVEILNKNKNKLTYFRDDSPEKITKTLQDDNGQISDEGLKFMDRMLQVCERSCSESDIISSISAVKDENGHIDMNKASYFIAKYAWGGSVSDIIRKVNQYGTENY